MPMLIRPAAFILKLNHSLQNSEGEEILDNMPLIDLGMDSLVAVEIRTWFMQEIGVEIPVMKVLGGASVADLVEHAVENLPQELLAQLANPETSVPSGTKENAIARTSPEEMSRQPSLSDSIGPIHSVKSDDKSLSLSSSSSGVDAETSATSLEDSGKLPKPKTDYFKM
jgi:hybrid polyketide synthase/nonribosomal peptide synthetase ACE1